MSLKGRTLLVTGASRGIGLAIAKRAAQDGANVTIAAKSVNPNPQLPGTIFTAASEVESAGGKALPIECDIRDESSIQNAIDRTVTTFGGIDILVNNASAIWIRGTEDTNSKKYDLMHQINGRGTWLTSKLCLPHLKKSAQAGRNPKILNLSPPLSLDAKWFKAHTAYTMAKFNMSMCVLGMAEEFRDEGIAVNALWPRTGIATAAISFIAGDELLKKCRTPEIMSDAAHIILTAPRDYTGKFCVDDEVLLASGVKDLSKYACVAGTPDSELMPDFFVDPIGKSKL